MSRLCTPGLAAALALLVAGGCDGYLDRGEGGAWRSGPDGWIVGDGGVAAVADGSASDGGSSGGDSATTPGADCPRVEIRVASGKVLNLRQSPSTSASVVGKLSSGAIVDLLAIVQGETIDGVSSWYRVRYGKLLGYIWSKLARCTTKRAPAFDGFYLPVVCGKRVKVTQGNFGSYSHTGRSAYAFDFGLGIGTKMVAMAAGVVSYVYNKTKPGDPCYSGGGPSCVKYANQVRVKHPDGTQTSYAHLSKVSVSLGQRVARAQVVGLSGSSGYSTGPHAHVARMRSCCQSIPLKFNDVKGGGVPKGGDYVTSGNCP